MGKLDFRPENHQPTFQNHLSIFYYTISFPIFSIFSNKQGQKIFAFRPGNWDPSEHTLLDNLRANLIAIEMLIEDEETQINGIVIVADFRSFGFSQAKALQPFVFKNYGQVLLNCFPIRIKGIHVLDQPKVFTVIFAIVSQFMKEKLRKRVYLHGGNIKGLHSHINKELLPSDYGGENTATSLKQWMRFVMNCEEEFQHLWL